MKLPAYVLITPARNEAQYIELTLKSVVAQTVRPLKWAIVSDGSTDGTDEIVGRYAARHPWIELVRTPERRERHFAGKVCAFNAGYARMRGLGYEVIGNLDADISFDCGYYECLLSKLAKDPRLGVVGTPFRESGSRAYNYRFVSIEHVSGFGQLFRRECFEEIGGYTPVKGGGIDHIAVVTARMKGWKTRTFTEYACVHHRVMGTAQRGPRMLSFRQGVKDYVLGGHPLWEVFRSVYQMGRPPYVVAGALLLCGYSWATIRRLERPVSEELMVFWRQEQMQRIKQVLARRRGVPTVAATDPSI